MPGPFPGMDPYLENPLLWPGVHNRLIVTMASALNAVLPPSYVALTEEWLYVLPAQRRIQPDVTLADLRIAGEMERSSRVSVAEPTARRIDEPQIVESPEDKPRILFINIVRAAAADEIVTTIELLSPANKQPGKDRQAYLRKQREVLASTTHLIEIDLLRTGTHTVAVPVERMDETDWDYIVCLHRGGTGKRYEIWPVRLQDRLPCVRVPLVDPDPDIALDLQVAIDRCYEEGAFARLIDYAQ